MKNTTDLEKLLYRCETLCAIPQSNPDDLFLTAFTIADVLSGAKAEYEELRKASEDGKDKKWTN